jgi:hypothetical protein
MKHSQVRRARKIGEAVFRGVGAVYTFDVFPLTTDVRDGGAVFIISRRITDRSKTGHHRSICIGEATSIVSEIKKHKRAKCAKALQANALCILREEDRKARSLVIDDLVAARSFTCVRNVSKPIAKPVTGKSRAKKVVNPPVSTNAVKTRASKGATAKSKTPDSKSTATAKRHVSTAAKKRTAANATPVRLIAQKSKNAPEQKRDAANKKGVQGRSNGERKRSDLGPALRANRRRAKKNSSKPAVIRAKLAA